MLNAAGLLRATQMRSDGNGWHFSWDGGGAQAFLILGLFLIVMGLILVVGSGVIARIIWLFGWILMVVGIIAAVLGIINWFASPRSRSS